MVTEITNLTKGKKEDGDKVKGLWYWGTQGKCPQSQEILSVLSTTLLGYSRKLFVPKADYWKTTGQWRVTSVLMEICLLPWPFSPLLGSSILYRPLFFCPLSHSFSAKGMKKQD